MCTVWHSKRCTVPILWLLQIPQYEEVKGVDVGVSRRDKWRDFRNYDINRILPQYEEVKRVGVGVSQRDTRRDFWHWWRDSALASPWYTQTTVCACTVPIFDTIKSTEYYHSTYNQLYNWCWQYVYRTNIMITTDNNGVFNWIDSYNNDFF